MNNWLFDGVRNQWSCLAERQHLANGNSKPTFSWSPTHLRWPHQRQLDEIRGLFRPTDGNSLSDVTCHFKAEVKSVKKEGNFEAHSWKGTQHHSIIILCLCSLSSLCSPSKVAQHVGLTSVTCSELAPPKLHGHIGCRRWAQSSAERMQLSYSMGNTKFSHALWVRNNPGQLQQRAPSPHEMPTLSGN